MHTRHAASRWPRIVADALHDVAHPFLTAAAGFRPGTLADVGEAIDSASAPERCAGIPPPFLLPHQIDSWRRVMFSLDVWRGAILTDRVGAGKTWIALAVAACSSRRTVAIVPAILRDQWSRAAHRAAVRIDLHTHERASRGTVPPGSPGLVIVDEAHRFRHLATRRVQTIAPWLIGRRVLLLTATPLVNRIGDLVALLRLAVADDALALDGIPRLGDLEHVAAAPPALRRVVIRSGHAPAMMARAMTTMTADNAERRRTEAAVAAIDQLRLSLSRGTRRLLRTVLLDAAQSSNAAFRAAIGRYRRLLLQVRDADGQASRGLVRRFAGGDLDQLVFWQLVGPASADADADVCVDDLAIVERILQRLVPGDAWVRAVREHATPDRPTVCFARHHATARLLRRSFGDQCAWVTGSSAGIGPRRLPRESVLAAFGPDRWRWRVRRRPPDVLVATDVAAEGLDLQAAGRIAHIDLPWTAVRLAQREGRLLRVGQRHADVEIVVRTPAPAIESALEPVARIRRKRALADTWLNGSLNGHEEHVAAAPPGVPVAILTDGEPGAWLVALRCRRDGCSGVQLLVNDGAGWMDGAAVFDAIRPGTFGADRADMSNVDNSIVADITAEAAAMARRRLGQAESASPPRLMRRIHALARPAAMRRDGVVLARLDRLLRFATSVSAPALGRQLLLGRLAECTDRELVQALVPEPRPRGPVVVTPTAVIGFPGAAQAHFPSAPSPLRSRHAGLPDRPVRP
jgi:Helicase conserved C-terminal domain/SNF2-related domain